MIALLAGKPTLRTGENSSRTPAQRCDLFGHGRRSSGLSAPGDIGLIARFIREDQNTIPVPAVQNCVEPCERIDCGQIEAFSLLRRFTGDGLKPVEADTVALGAPGFHRTDAGHTHFHRLLDDEIRLRAFDRGKQQPQIRHAGLDPALLKGCQDRGLAVRVGHLCDPLPVATIEQADRIAGRASHDGHQIMAGITVKTQGLAGTQMVFNIQAGCGCAHGSPCGIAEPVPSSGLETAACLCQTAIMQLNTDRRVADSLPTSWVDHAPEALRPYLRLARYDRPIGFWLLALPGWHGLLLASIGVGLSLQTLWYAGLIALGAIAMRGAGCTYNDIIDKDLDAQVARTADRPLAAGTVSLRQAWIFLIAQCLVGLIVLVQFPLPAIIVALVSLLLVAAYPFMKRITWWPQAWLGLTFNWGVPVAYVAVAGQIDLALVALYAASVFWTLGYDTIYAHQDAEDDALVGIRSTARLFGRHSPYWIAGFYALTALFVGLASWLVAASPWFVFGYALYTIHLFNQVRRMDTDKGAVCLAVFKSNRTSGLILVAALALAAWLG